MKDPLAAKIRRTFEEAVAMVDASEDKIRAMIENDLMDVAGINRTKVSDAILACDDLSKKISAIRHHHIKKAFQHLKANLPKSEFEGIENVS
jgi:hypothetical protein